VTAKGAAATLECQCTVFFAKVHVYTMKPAARQPLGVDFGVFWGLLFR
jgi:hypothetical protein